MEGGEWRIEGGGMIMEDGGWKTNGGEWRVEGGEWRVERRVECGDRSRFRGTTQCINFKP